MRALTAEAAEEHGAPTPVLPSLDIKAAFPSLVPEWMAEALAATEAPEEVKRFVAALCAGSAAKYRTDTDVITMFEKGSGVAQAARLVAASLYWRSTRRCAW